MIFIDTETCGLHGPIIIIQYAEDDGEVHIHEVWTSPICDTLNLIEKFCKSEIVGFNLAFDWFHICQTYNTLRLFPDYTEYPEDHIDELVELEEQARFGPCLKPVKACDLMLIARKGYYQSTMDRDDIKIKKVPTVLAWKLADELERKLYLKNIYFKRRKDQNKPKWTIEDTETPEFKDIVLRFKPSSALKALAEDALKLKEEDILLFRDVELPKKAQPLEYGFSPYAKSVGYGAWPDIIDYHIEHWRHNSLAREYAKKDVLLTRDLYKFFDSPSPGDIDSELACMVGAVRWKGFKINVDGIKELKEKAKQKIKKVPTAPAQVKKYIEEHMSDTEKIVFDSTKKQVLEQISRGKEIPAKRAREVLEARQAESEIRIYDKLIRAKRFHASFKVIGTLSTRMAGADDLNPQGINRDKNVRRQFLLADDDMILCGGDAESFEVVLMDAAFKDPDLRKDLISGKKIHAIFGTFLFPNKTYEQILKTKGLPGYEDIYTRSKNGVFALAYGGTDYTLSTRVAISKEAAQEGYEKWIKKYKVWGKERSKIFDKFCSMRQPNGIGTKVEWHEPAEYIESLFGFRRYFTLENKICKFLYDLAQNPPKEWRKIKIKLVRRDRQQLAAGALQSALYASAFGIQAAAMRAAGNHIIQSSGAQIIKDLQKRIWDLQPSGINNWIVQPLNIHDEIMTPTHPDYVDKVSKVVEDLVEEYRKIVPLLEIDWKTNIKYWGDL